MNPDQFPLSMFEVDCDGSACGSSGACPHIHPPQDSLPAIGRVTVRNRKRIRYGTAKGIIRMTTRR
jgi:hypothetical protein